MLFQKYLPLSSLDQWQQEPESFIELEDDNYLMLEFDMDPDMTLSLPPFHAIAQPNRKVYYTAFPTTGERPVGGEVWCGWWVVGWGGRD